MMKFQSIYPDFKGPNSAEESVAMQKNDIEKITIEDSGEFLSHLGTKEQCAYDRGGRSNPASGLRRT